jgi:formamidopyrimidine-DNA glycosylase
MGVYPLTHEDWEKRKQSNKAKIDPLDKELNEDKFFEFINSDPEFRTMNIKIFLAKNVAGIMSTYASEILWKAHVYPKVINKLNDDELKAIFSAMTGIITESISKNGKDSEFDLYRKKGGYHSVTERKNIGKPCPVCNSEFIKVSVGGVTAVCPKCQVK